MPETLLTTLSKHIKQVSRTPPKFVVSFGLLADINDNGETRLTCIVDSSKIGVVDKLQCLIGVVDTGEEFLPLCY
jgi:hypothetical protein